MASVEARQQPGIIDLSSGFESGLEDLPRIARRAVKQVAGSLFNYDLPQGQLMLRQQISRMVQHGLDVTPEDLIITNGSKQAVSSSSLRHVKPGIVIVESPTWHGMLSLCTTWEQR